MLAVGVDDDPIGSVGPLGPLWVLSCACTVQKDTQPFFCSSLLLFLYFFFCFFLLYLSTFQVDLFSGPPFVYPCDGAGAGGLSWNIFFTQERQLQHLPHRR